MSHENCLNFVRFGHFIEVVTRQTGIPVLPELLPKSVGLGQYRTIRIPPLSLPVSAHVRSRVDRFFVLLENQDEMLVIENQHQIQVVPIRLTTGPQTVIPGLVLSHKI